MRVGRKRKGGNPLGLELRVYWRRGQFKYVHRDGREEPLGRDIEKANKRARIYNDPKGRYGTVGYFLDAYIADAKAGRLHKKKAPRTIRDNEVEAEWLKLSFDNTDPMLLVREPSLIADYRDARGAPIRANRELSLLSSLYTWMIDKGHVPGLNANPVKLIQRNPQPAKERYVEDAEFRPVYAIAQRSVCMAMDLVYQTLQRPADVLALGSLQVRDKTVNGKSVRVVSFTQGKTGRTVDIEATPEIEATLRSLSKDGEELGRVTIADGVQRMLPTLVHDLKGTAYTVDGVGAMLRRYCHLAGVKSFGLMDLRAKGATDMYLNGIPLEHIQMLMGHESVRTTEIYIKQLLRTVSVASPNKVKISA